MTVALANKTIHVLSVMGVMGGLMFAYFVLVPLGTRDNALPESRGLWKRWGISIAIFWVAALITGFINLEIMTHARQPVNAHYQMLLGIKMAIAIGMFLVTLVIGHPPPALVGLAKGRAAWLIVLLIAGVAVVLLSAKLNTSRVDRTGLVEVRRTKPAVPTNTNGS